MFVDPTGQFFSEAVTRLREQFEEWNIRPRYTPAYRDVTDEVSRALEKEAESAISYSKITKWLFGDNFFSLAVICLDFRERVNHNCDWDIKLQQPWENTIGTPYPGAGSIVVFAGEPMQIDKLGNFTYGFIGYAYGIPLELLVPGSYYTAGFPTGGEKLIDEIVDWHYIALGYYYVCDFNTWRVEQTRDTAPHQ